MGLIQMAVAVLIRLPALYIAVSRESYYRVEAGTLVMLALFSALLGVVMPATGFLDIGGALFRVVLFTVIVMVVVRTEVLDSLGIVVVAAIIEAVIILGFSISPFAWLVEGMNVLSIP